MCSQFFLLLQIFVHITTISTGPGDLFLVSPGDGEEFVYSPVDVNATLHCAVNNMDLEWAVDSSSFESTLHTHTLHSRGIFQSEPVTSSEGVTTSSVTVFGDLAENNNSRICCQTLNEGAFEISEECTTLILYGRPSPPELVTLQYNEATIEINISWSHNITLSVMGVDQNYTIYFDSDKAETTQLFYIYRQNTANSNIRCSAYVKAVNGAGESDPSNNVTIPSLPDIGPVTASLSHQVWKSTGGEIMVNVSLKPAIYCSADPVYAFVITLISEMIKDTIIISMLHNETEVTIGPLDGLKDNKKYHYTVKAKNNVGNSMANGKVIVTSDVQSVTATVVGESTIDIQCLFIHGSDAVGCKVVLVSDHPSVNNKTTTLIRRHTSASAQLNLTHKVTCYQRLLAYTIDVNKTTHTFFIEEKLNSSYFMCSATGNDDSSLVAIIMSIFISLTLLVFLVITLSVIILKKKRESWKNKSGDETKSNCYVSADSKYQTYKTKELDTVTQNPAPLLQKSHSDQTLQKTSQSPQLHSPPKAPVTSVPNSYDKSLVTDANAYPSKIPLVSMPLYAIPEKIKMTGNLKKDQSLCQHIDKENSGNPEGKSNDEENFYHVLENDKAPSKCDVTTLVSPTPELTTLMEAGSSESNTLPPQITPQKSAPCMPLICDEVGNSATNYDLEGRDSTEALAVPLYAVPDKVRSKNKSVLSQSSCVSALQEESGELNNTLEHFYHVLEVNKPPHKVKETPLDSNTPQLPPPFKPDTPPSHPPPIYQDIMTLTHN